MVAIHDIIARVAPSDSRVLILGENGTGKELVARAIHEQSRRNRRPFIKVNSAALPKELIESELFGHEKGAFTGASEQRRGKFEQAQGGTLFLDEIGDMAMEAQAKLLRVLSANEIHRVGGNGPIPIDVRIIAASNRWLPDMLRADLYHRLAVVEIIVPPLRNRRDEIPGLVREFIAEIRPCAIHDDASEILMRYSWPGNIRELKNAIEYAALMCKSTIRPEHLPDRVVTGSLTDPLLCGPPLYTMREMKRRYLVAVLQHTGWHHTEAARILGINTSTIYRLMIQFGLKGEPHARSDDRCNVDVAVPSAS